MVNVSDAVTTGVTYVDTVFSGLLTRLALTLLILLIGFILGRVVAKVLARFLHELELDKSLQRAGFTMPIEATLASLLSYFIYLIAIIMALDRLGLTVVVLYIIVGGAILLIFASTILGVKDFIPNIIAGFYIYRKKLFRIGQRITVGTAEGRVKSINLVETELQTKDGDRVHVPNSLIVKSLVLVKK